MIKVNGAYKPGRYENIWLKSLGAYGVSVDGDGRQRTMSYLGTQCRSWLKQPKRNRDGS